MTTAREGTLKVEVDLPRSFLARRSRTVALERCGIAEVFPEERRHLALQAEGPRGEGDFYAVAVAALAVASAV
jgi:hypothetical protein